MIHVYTGDGKGKTTAAVGLCLRALGHGMSVLFVEFLKGSGAGEISALEELGARVLYPSHEHGFWWTLGEPEKKIVRREHDAVLRTTLDCCRSAHPPDVLVLDEFTYVYNGARADRALCDELLAARGPGVETVITGREAGALADRADYLTEMKARKHPYTHGQIARVGIEF